MKTVYILEDDDIIQPDDWIRPLDFDGEANTRSMYSGTPQNNTKWVLVCECFGDWIKGMTVKQIHDNIERKSLYAANGTMRYEFLRGFIPKKHML